MRPYLALINGLVALAGACFAMFTHRWDAMVWALSSFCWSFAYFGSK